MRFQHCTQQFDLIFCSDPQLQPFVHKHSLTQEWKNNEKVRVNCGSFFSSLRNSFSSRTFSEAPKKNGDRNTEFLRRSNGPSSENLRPTPGEPGVEERDLVRKDIAWAKRRDAVKYVWLAGGWGDAENLLQNGLIEYRSFTRCPWAAAAWQQSSHHNHRVWVMSERACLRGLIRTRF